MKQHGGNYPFELQNGRITQHTEQRRWTKIRKVWMKWRDRWKCVRVRVCTHVRHTSMWFQWFPVYTSMCSGKTIAPAATCRYIRIGIKKKKKFSHSKERKKLNSFANVYAILFIWHIDFSHEFSQIIIRFTFCCCCCEEQRKQIR